MHNTLNSIVPLLVKYYEARQHFVLFALNTEAEDYFVSILWPFRELQNLLSSIISVIAAIFPPFWLRKHISLFY